MKGGVRTIVLGDDGRFVTLGRASHPSDAELAAAAAAMASQGIGGWLSTMAGTLYQRRCPALMQLRELAPPRQSWDAAVAAFRAAHARQQAALRSRASAALG